MLSEAGSMPASPLARCDRLTPMGMRPMPLYFSKIKPESPRHRDFFVCRQMPSGRYPTQKGKENVRLVLWQKKRKSKTIMPSPPALAAHRPPRPRAVRHQEVRLLNTNGRIMPGILSPAFRRWRAAVNRRARRRAARKIPCDPAWIFWTR